MSRIHLQPRFLRPSSALLRAEQSISIQRMQGGKQRGGLGENGLGVEGGGGGGRVEAGGDDLGGEGGEELDEGLEGEWWSVDHIARLR
jgi:hypothetical protein